MGPHENTYKSFRAYEKREKHPAPKIIANLGRIDLIKEGQFDALIEGFSKYSAHHKTIDIQKDLFLEDSILLGPRLIVEKIWKKLGLDKILQEAGCWVAKNGLLH